jgi:hypothetical protein
MFQIHMQAAVSIPSAGLLGLCGQMNLNNNQIKKETLKDAAGPPDLGSSTFRKIRRQVEFLASRNLVDMYFLWRYSPQRA